MIRRSKWGRPNDIRQHIRGIDAANILRKLREYQNRWVFLSRCIRYIKQQDPQLWRRAQQVAQEKL